MSAEFLEEMALRFVRRPRRSASTLALLAVSAALLLVCMLLAHRYGFRLFSPFDSGL